VDGRQQKQQERFVSEQEHLGNSCGHFPRNVSYNFYKKIFGTLIRLKHDISYNIYTLNEITVELHLPGLIGTARHPDVQKIRIIGSFLEIGYIGNLKFGCY
jgi:hypothetical protein